MTHQSIVAAAGALRKYERDVILPSAERCATSVVLAFLDAVKDPPVGMDRHMGSIWRSVIETLRNDVEPLRQGAAAMSELLTKGKVAVSVLFDTVSIELHCGDAYEAQSLYDEIIERLSRGEGLTLGMKQPEPLPALQQAEKNDGK